MTRATWRRSHRPQPRPPIDARAIRAARERSVPVYWHGDEAIVLTPVRRAGAGTIFRPSDEL